MIDQILLALDVPVTETNGDQMGVLMEAMKTFGVKNEKYKDLWKDYGEEDILLHIKSKAARLMRAGDSEDAIDLINYAVFYVRLSRATS